MNARTLQTRLERSMALVADSRIALAKARTLLAVSKLVRAHADEHQRVSRKLVEAARAAVTAPR